MTEKDAKNITDFIDIYEQESQESLRKFVNEHDIKDVDENIILALGNVRRPLVLMRGKPITVEQTIQLITGEEPLFGEGAKCEGCCLDPRSDRGILKNIFYRQGYDWLSTWVYSDGTIGGDIVFLGKYPEWDEMILPYMHLAKKYPFLDMTISYTMYDECCCAMCSMIEPPYKGYGEECKCKDCMPYLDKIIRYSPFHGGGREWNEYPDFEELYFRNWDTAHVRSDVADSVTLTIWIHSGKTDILFGEKAASKFNEYNNLYCAPEYAFMFSDLYEHNLNCICNKSFVEDCFEYIGKPRSLCDEYVERKFIAPFNKNAIVVTKKWVTEQYNTYIMTPSLLSRHTL